MRKGVYQADGAIKAEDMMNVADVCSSHSDDGPIASNHECAGNNDYGK
ncbi:hypothetical protein ACMFFX_25340 [Escherichia coli]